MCYLVFWLVCSHLHSSLWHTYCDDSPWRRRTLVRHFHQKVNTKVISLSFLISGPSSRCEELITYITARSGCGKRKEKHFRAEVKSIKEEDFHCYTEELLRPFMCILFFPHNCTLYTTHTHTHTHMPAATHSEAHIRSWNGAVKELEEFHIWFKYSHRGVFWRLWSKYCRLFKYPVSKPRCSWVFNSSVELRLVID